MAFIVLTGNSRLPSCHDIDLSIIVGKYIYMADLQSILVIISHTHTQSVSRAQLQRICITAELQCICIALHTLDYFFFKVVTTI